MFNASTTPVPVPPVVLINLSVLPEVNPDDKNVSNVAVNGPIVSRGIFLYVAVMLNAIYHK